jgi:hypothetical protein
MQGCVLDRGKVTRSSEGGNEHSSSIKYEGIIDRIIRCHLFSGDCATCCQVTA